MNNNNNNFLYEDISTLKGVGSKLKKYLKRKKIDKVKDLLFDFPYSFTDRTKITEIKNLEIGKIANINVKPLKYNFPRIRNLPNKVICKDRSSKINIIFFNTNEYYIKKIFPLDKDIIVSGKVSFYNKSYQITNPTYVKPIQNKDEILKIFSNYALTEGLNEKTYRKQKNRILIKIQGDNDWHTDLFLKKNNFNRIKQTFENLHNKSKKNNYKSNDQRRIAYDEIFSNLLVLLKTRKVIKIKRKTNRLFNFDNENKVLQNFGHPLTNGQRKILSDIKNDLKSNFRMFRLVQGDVGSGKTIISLLISANVINSNLQVAYMAPTEILTNQQFEQAKNLFKGTGIIVSKLTGKTKNKRQVYENLLNGKTNFLIGTHSLFQKKVKFKNLGLIIIDEQHKFGVKQRISLAKKGGESCDLILMSATPIPRSMMMSIYGDMDISRLMEKPKYRKKTITLIKPEEKINEIIPFLKKSIIKGDQIFWICPLIEESKKINYSSAVKKFNLIKEIFKNKVGLVHGNLDEKEKNLVIKKFSEKKISILVSTTVIEVGIDIPNANIIIIEDANKFGLSQLQQLRGRVGRGNMESTCILLYKKNLSENAKERLKILRSTSDGFLIAEKDLKLRGHGDLLGYQQSGIKSFKFADPIHHEDLFVLAENEIKKNYTVNFSKYKYLLKLFDKAEIIKDIKE